MNRNPKWLATWFFLAAVACAGLPAQATAPASLETRDFRIGLRGCFQVGTWTSASVTVIGSSSGPAKLIVIAPDADGNLVRSEGPIQTLQAGQPQRLTAQFCSGRQGGDITLRVEAEEGVAERTFRPGSDSNADLSAELSRGFKQDIPFWGVCGAPNSVLATSQLVGGASATPAPTGTNASATNEDQPPQILRLDLSDLPESAIDLAAMDLLVLAAGANLAGTANGDSVPLFSKLTEKQVEALRDWVQVRGGHLILSLGSHAQEFQDSKLGQWLKLPLEGDEETRQLSSLEAYSGHQQPLKVDRPVSYVRLGSSPANQVLAQSFGIPLLIQTPRGFGRVSFLGVDLDRPPVSNWDGVGLMLQRLQRGDRSDLTRETRQQSTQLAKSGINDLSSQLYAAEEEFPGVRRLSLWVVMLLIGAYILIVGPLDYVIVHRWLKRPGLTWVTLPLWIVTGSAFAIWLSSSLNGTSLMARQLEIVDIDAMSGVVRSRSWLTVYSPKTSRRSIELDTTPSEWLRSPDQPPFKPATNWLAPAENRVGGLYREGGVQLTQRQYQRTASGIADYPLQVWSTGRFGAEWSSVTPTLVESKLVSSGFGQLTGTIMHRFPEMLEDCMLVYGNRVYFPVIQVNRKKTSNLPKFVTWDIGHGQPLEQRELRGFLTEIYTKQIIRDNSKTGPEVRDISKPYDPARRDLPYILRILSFHQSAGGQDYTGLRNDVLESLDLSQQVRLGRAVLIGRLKQPSARWNVDGAAVSDPDSTTYVRIVLPVDKDANTVYRPLEKPDEGLKGAPSETVPVETVPEKDED